MHSECVASTIILVCRPATEVQPLFKSPAVWVVQRAKSLPLRHLRNQRLQWRELALQRGSLNLHNLHSLELVTRSLLESREGKNGM